MGAQELQVLHEIAGELPPSPWGAWVGVCLEHLYGSGYITAKFGGKLTKKGREAISKVIAK